MVKKRGQAAMEFIMGYGWAILVVLVAVGALAYFGVLKPDKLLPRKCVIQPGIHCEDFKVQEDSATFLLKNALGKNMEILSIQVEHCTGTDSGTILNDQTTQFVVDGCTNTADEKFKAEMNISYSLDGGLARVKKGNIVALVEEGGIISLSDDFSENPPAGHFGFNTNALPPDSYSGWTVQEGSWIIEDGYLKNWYGPDTITLNSPASQVGKAIRAKALETQSWRYPTFLLGWQDEDNYYSLQFSSSNSNT